MYKTRSLIAESDHSIPTQEKPTWVVGPDDEPLALANTPALASRIAGALNAQAEMLAWVVQHREALRAANLPMPRIAQARQE